MTGPEGNSKFCFPQISNIEILEEQNLLFLSGPVIKCLLFLVFSLYAVKVRWLQRGLQRDINKSNKIFCKVEFEYGFVQEYWGLIIRCLKMAELESK